MFAKHTPILTTYECASILKPLTDSLSSQAVSNLLDDTYKKSDLDNFAVGVLLNKGFKNNIENIRLTLALKGHDKINRKRQRKNH